MMGILVTLNAMLIFCLLVMFTRLEFGDYACCYRVRKLISDTLRITWMLIARLGVNHIVQKVVHLVCVVIVTAHARAKTSIVNILRSEKMH